jgi:nucleoid-associated protein YgaU
VLNRLGFGARPGDVERVKRIGLDRYVRQQLDPASIDDAAADRAVAHLDTLRMDSGHFVGQFYDDIKFYLQMQMAAGNADEMKMRFGVDLPGQKKPDAGMGANGMGGGGMAGGDGRPAAANPYSPTGLPNLKALSERDAIRCMGRSSTPSWCGRSCPSGS